MLKKVSKLILLLAMGLAMLTITSCDRYKHTFDPVVETDFEEVIFTPLTTAMGDISATDLTPVMSFYDEDYLHNGQTKTDREAFYQNLFNLSAAPIFEVTLLNQAQQNDTLAVSNWRLRVRDNANQVIADSTFFGEQLINRGKGWKLFGNRDDCCDSIVLQKVFIEEFTYTTCPNCPVVEAILHDLELAYPNQLTYLEYHINDPISPLPANMDIYGYYGNPSFPVVIFQGETKIQGNNADNEAVFNQLAQNLSTQQSRLNINNPQYSIIGTEISGSVQLDVVDENITQTNMKLKYALIDKVSDTYNNNAGVPCRNSVLKKGEIALATADLSQPINFSMTYTGTIPDGDAFLVFWVQDVPATFQNNATVYNCIEVPVSPAKIYIKK